jgi:hypothetical protein
MDEPDEVQDFFVNNHGLEGEKYRLLCCKGHNCFPID